MTYLGRFYLDFSVVDMLVQSVGFIGLGNMGFHMASNLINAGYKVTAHDM